MRNLTGHLYQLLYNHRKLIGGVAVVGAAVLMLDYCGHRKPVVYSPHIYNKKGHEISIKKPLIPGEYSAVPGKGEHVYKITIDVKGDSKSPTEKTLTFIVKNDQRLELDTIGYSKKGERVASEKTIIYGEKSEIKKPEIKQPIKIEEPKTVTPPKIIEEIKEEPKKFVLLLPRIEEQKPLEQTIIEETKPKPFDLGQNTATSYKIQLPDRDGWFLNFGSTLAHSKDGKEGVIEFLSPVDIEEGEKVKKSCYIAADVPKKFFWDHQKPKAQMNTRTDINNFVKSLLDTGYVIKGQNEDGLFLFDKESIEKYDIKVTLDQYKGLLPKRLCDVVTWKEDRVELTGGGDSGAGGGGAGGGGAGGGGSK